MMYSHRISMLALFFLTCHAFTSPETTRNFSVKDHTTTSQLALHSSKDDSCGNGKDVPPSSRRSFLVGAATLAAPAIMLVPSPVYARDEIFRASPLTNPLLEQIRIWEQAEADNLKYGGELEAGDAGNKGKVGAYPSLLVPILKMDQELEQVQALVRGEDRSTAWPKALAILQNDKYGKIGFKKTFNAYGDNIYYSDPDRANVYLGGGAAPKTEQSLAYLLRNDILTNVENLKAELEFLQKSGESEVEDLYSYSDVATSAMKKYLSIVPPKELQEAKKILDGN